MGNNDNRRSKKMRRRIRQVKLKTRMARKLAEAKAKKVVAPPPAAVAAMAAAAAKPAAKKAKKKVAAAEPAE